VQAEALVVMVAVMADFVFNPWDLEIFRITVFGTYHGASIIMRRTFDWERSSICMLDMDAVPQGCIPYS
jgi:hypothetical protein